MSIDRINISNRGIEGHGTVDRTSRTQATESPRRPAEHSGTPHDSVDVSARAREIDRVANLIEASRTERLEQVRQALQNGTYHVSGEEIARKLIDANRK